MQWQDLIIQKKKSHGPNWDESYREFIVTYLKANNIDISGKHHYSFGIWGGNGLRKMYEMFRYYDVIPEKILAFDSFEGLPDEHPGIQRNVLHPRGAYNVKDIEPYKNDTPRQIIAKIMATFPDNQIPVDWHVGFYEQVLSEKFMTLNPKPAFWVELDVDLYISSIQVLDFMFQNHLILPGTLVSFDDWGATEEYKGGESLAWKEMCQKHAVTANELYDIHGGDKRLPTAFCAKVFSVEKIGRSG
jgi:hypothetical protein